MAGNSSPTTICKLSRVSVFHPTGTTGGFRLWEGDRSRQRGAPAGLRVCPVCVRTAASVCKTRVCIHSLPALLPKVFPEERIVELPEKWELRLTGTWGN